MRFRSDLELEEAFRQARPAPDPRRLRALHLRRLIEHVVGPSPKPDGDGPEPQEDEPGSRA